MTIEEKRRRYQEIAHAMQTGVAYVMEKDPSAASPKHLRVGVNMAMIEHSVLTNLLIQKGIITEDEYWDEVIKTLEREVEMYTQQVRKLYGTDKITLG